MSKGGWWSDRPRGFIERQIELQIKDGIAPDHAKRFALAVEFGGCSEAEVWDIVKDRDCFRHGYFHEKHHIDDLPQDYAFSEAWYRSHNGGPILEDLEKAKPIQWKRIMIALNEENKKRELELFGKNPLVIDRIGVQSAIKYARDISELKKIWPDELPK